MKNTLMRMLVLSLLTVGSGISRAALYASWNGSRAIPEDVSGLAFSFTLSSSQHFMTEVSVMLNISGGYNGDLYAYLSHGAGFAVLLNRVGRTSDNSDGYSNPGFLVTLTGSATADVHNYESLGGILNGNGQITGTWGADGRDADPAEALDTTQRTAELNSFYGQDPNGAWVIYFFDASSGGVSTVNSWAVDVSTDVFAVPEPSGVILGICEALFVIASLGLYSGKGRLGKSCDLCDMKRTSSH